MKLGTMGKYTPEGFDYIKSKGLDFLEIVTNFDDDTEEFNESGDAIKAEIARTGIPVGSVGRWNAVTNVAGKVDRNIIDSLKKSIDVTADIGCSVFVCGVNYDESVSLYRNLVCAVDVLGELGEHAKEKNVKIGVYNCQWTNFVHSTDTWKIVLGELPDIGIKYDCSHSYKRGQDYIAELEEWIDRVVHMHIKGSLMVNGKFVDDPPAGMDAIAWPQIFGILYAHDYKGGLSIEPHSRIWSKRDYAESGFDFTIDYVNKFLFRK